MLLTYQLVGLFMRTRQTHSPTKEKLLDAARELMLSKGFDATTVDEICEAANFTKGSFFHYFKSKEDLGKAVLDRFVSARYQAIQSAPFSKSRDPLKRVYGYLDFVIKMSKEPSERKGCLLGSFAQDLSETHPEIRKSCAHHFTGWSTLLKRDLDLANAKYAPKARSDTGSLAEHFIAVFEGSIILAKSNRDPEVVEKNLRHFKRYLKSLFEG